MSDTVSEPYSFQIPAIRHDGWSGESMTKFLKTLAETGIVVEACEEAGKSKQSAYALRRRDPLFAKAWELALGSARDQLADILLGRSIEGNVEQIIKDGVVVAEKHYLDNRLGLAILKRLDQRTESVHRPLPSAPDGPSGLDVALDALRTGKADDIATALAMLGGSEIDEVDSPAIDEAEDDNLGTDRVWQSLDNDEWRTDFPPPPDFCGHQQSEWGLTGYNRSLTPDEMAALIDAGIADPEDADFEIRVEVDEAERDAFFASLTAADPQQTAEAEI